MKNFTQKIALLIVFIILYSSALAQKMNQLDSLLVKVDQSLVTSGIIYERVTPMADLYAFNYAGTEHNIADYGFFKQALSEMYRASNQVKFISVESMKAKIKDDENDKTVVNIGILNTPFEILNYNYEEPEEGGLIFRDSLFEQIPGRPPFYSLYAFVAAPLKKSVSGEQINFKFREDLIFNNGDKTIKSLKADLGDGIRRDIIVSGELVLPVVMVNNSFPNGYRKLSFMVVFNDGLSVTSFGNLYFHNQNNSVNCAEDNLREDLYSASSRLVSAYAHQGYGETTSRHGEIQARVFYRTKNGNTQKVLQKPLIIVDGFDPGDTRRIEDCDCEADSDCASGYADDNGMFDSDSHDSIVDLMGYINENEQDDNLIRVLRENLGFDVIIVNQPTYLKNGIKIDGGADFIERNGKALVTLIEQVNTTLQQNSSSEQLVVIGPSMGGQISRYALAYMEKNNIPHNTRLWVSFDSPHHGANIPMGDQSLINLLASESEIAKEQYEDLLGSIAARQQLIEFHKAVPYQIGPFIFPNLLVEHTYLNGQISGQVLPTNSGNPLYKEHYTHQYNNGLSGSKGFPVNLRKIALINGSLTGKKVGNHNENVLDLRGFQRVCISPLSWFGVGGFTICWTIKLTEMKSNFLPPTGSTSTVASFMQLGGAGESTTSTISPNLNNRGNMDIVPGGLLDTQNLIAGAVTGESIFSTRGSFWQYTQDNLLYWLSSTLGGTWWEARNVKKYHSFIPTFSAIAHKQPNQSWFNPLNKNLVCSDETYFDSYYGESENTEHVTLNYSMVNWLLQELQGNEQDPYFPVNPDKLEGTNIVCSTSGSTFGFYDLCEIPGEVANWSVTNKLTIVSSGSYEVVVKGINGTNGWATIIATFQSGVKVSKQVWVGKPTTPTVGGITNAAQNSILTYTANAQGSTSYEWILPGNFQVVNYFNLNINEWQIKSEHINASTIAPYSGNPGQAGTIKVRAYNQCGYSDWASMTVSFPSQGGTGITPHPGENNTGLIYRVAPNPSSNIVYVNLLNENIEPNENSIITGNLFDYQGFHKENIQIINNKATIDVSGLPKGIYILQIIIDGRSEGHQIIVQ